MTRRSCNLPFRGGARGIAHAGAIDVLRPQREIVDVAGTSAGTHEVAPVVRSSGKELKETLEDPKTASTIDRCGCEVQETNRGRLKRSRANHGEARGAGWPRRPLAGDLWRLRSWQKELRTVDEDLRGIWRNRGIHRTDKVYDWLDGHLQEFMCEPVEKLKHMRSLRILA